MLAMFAAQQIILGKPYASFDTVPTVLKAQVAEILKDSGVPHLITDENYK